MRRDLQSDTSVDRVTVLRSLLLPTTCSPLYNYRYSQNARGNAFAAEQDVQLALDCNALAVGKPLIEQLQQLHTDGNV